MIQNTADERRNVRLEFVTGSVALYAARYPEASPTQIREAILSTAKRTKSLEGLVATNGRLNIKATLEHAPK